MQFLCIEQSIYKKWNRIRKIGIKESQPLVLEEAKRLEKTLTEMMKQEEETHF